MKKIIAFVAFSFFLLLLFQCNSDRKDHEKLNDTRTYLRDTAIYNHYLKEGSRYATQTGAVLFKNLTEAIAARGTAYAITFCQTKAIHLTDSMSALQQVSVKRVTSKPRNVRNMADPAELQYINTLQKIIADGRKPLPQLQESGESIIGYYPIITNDMCMQCHGEKSSIDTKTFARLAQGYPPPILLQDTSPTS